MPTTKSDIDQTNERIRQHEAEIEEQKRLAKEAKTATKKLRKSELKASRARAMNAARQTGYTRPIIMLNERPDGVDFPRKYFLTFLGPEVADGYRHMYSVQLTERSPESDFWGDLEMYDRVHGTDLWDRIDMDDLWDIGDLCEGTLVESWDDVLMCERSRLRTSKTAPKSGKTTATGKSAGTVESRSILSEYGQIRREMGEDEFRSIERFLETHPSYDLSDVYYTRGGWNAYETWKLKQGGKAASKSRKTSATTSGATSMRFANRTDMGLPIVRMYQDGDVYYAVARDLGVPGDLVWGVDYHPDEGYWESGYYGCGPKDIERYARGMRLIVDNGPLTGEKSAGTSKTASKSRKTSAAKRSAGASRTKAGKAPVKKSASMSVSKKSPAKSTKVSTARTTKGR